MCVFSAAATPRRSRRSRRHTPHIVMKVYQMFEKFSIFYAYLLLGLANLRNSYSIVQDSDTDSRVIFKFLQNVPLIKAFWTFKKMCVFRLAEAVEAAATRRTLECKCKNVQKVFMPLLKKNRTINDCGRILKFQVSTVKSALLSLTILLK